MAADQKMILLREISQIRNSKDLDSESKTFLISEKQKTLRHLIAEEMGQQSLNLTPSSTPTPPPTSPPAKK